METSIQRTANNNVFIPVIRKSENVSPVVVPYLVPQAVPAPKKEIRNLPFIEANTKEVTLSHVKDDCIIPVFSKDNEVTISHQSFIDSVLSAAQTVFPREDISDPVIRVSHVVKGRIPEAIHKPVSQLLESDKTIYYERMMFCIEIPSIHQDIDGCRLNLTIGGVRAYNEQNLYSRKAPEKFRIFIGFKNMVCCNLCVSTDGYKASLRVMDPDALLSAASELFRSYDMERHLTQMAAFRECRMSESQFAQFLGKCRLYQYLPSSRKKQLPELLMTDTQVGLVAKSYLEDPDFGRDDANTISLWKVFNLLTGANKSSYIDNFLDRAENATALTSGLCMALYGDPEYSWFLS
ncbi:MAG: DUF3871 family protein [Bacteroidales bacterium]|nr:DUF3871 family protein [Bacteroidales bacterium]